MSLLALPRPRRNTRPAALPVPAVDLRLNARQMVGNLLVTRSGAVFAGFALAPQQWSFGSADQRRSLWSGSVDTWALTVGRVVHERVTSRPYPVRRHAERLDRRTPSPLDVDAWNDYLARMQRRTREAAGDEDITFRYLRVGSADPRLDVRSGVTDAQAGRKPPREVQDLLTQERRLREKVAGPGWGARPMTEREQEWLRFRSIAPGIAPPARPRVDGGWDDTHMAAFTDGVEWEEQPGDRTVKVTAWRRHGNALVPVVRHVAVLTMGRMGEQRFPESGLEPWQTYARRARDGDGASFPVEWALAGYLATGQDVARRADLDLRKALNMRQGYEEFGEPVPRETDRVIDHAVRVHDEVTTGRDRDASRFLGVINALVWGEDQHDEDGNVVRSATEVCLERAESLRDLYGGNEMRMSLEHPGAQGAKLREFVTGEPWDQRGYQHSLPLSYLAAGFPNTNAAVGDRSGPYYAYTRGSSRRPVHHDPHYATEGGGDVGRRENLWTMEGTLGAGKSVLMGAILLPAVRRRIRACVYDPSGPMGRYCNIQEFRDVSLHLNMLDAEPGTLSPPAVIREPRIEEYTDWDDHLPERRSAVAMDKWRRACAEARGARAGLVRSMARQCLDADLYSHPDTQRLLRAAVRGVEWHAWRSMWDLVDGLLTLARDRGERQALELASALVDASQMPRLALMFPPRSDAGDFVGAQHKDTVLTVVTTPGLKPAPDDKPREDWSTDELAAGPLRHLAALYTGREVYGKPMDERALVMFDEAEDLDEEAAGRVLMSRLGRDHSKWNLAVYLSFKKIKKETEDSLSAYRAGAWVGRTKSREHAEDALARRLGITDMGYADTLMGLSSVYPGEFAHRDLDGNVEVIRVDTPWLPELEEAAFTNPGARGAAAEWASWADDDLGLAG